MPKVLNRHHGSIPPSAVYIGRGTPFGNPFIVGVHGSRKEVCDQYEQLLLSSPDLIDRVKRELRGKDLVCSCAPRTCHGDILLKIANEEECDVGLLRILWS